MFFKWANWTVWEIPNMRNTVFDSLLSSCRAMKVYIEYYSLTGDYNMNINLLTTRHRERLLGDLLKAHEPIKINHDIAIKIWLTEALKQQTGKKNKLYMKYLKPKSAQNESYYKRYKTN